MARRRFTVEQIIGKLREAEVAIGKGLTVPQASRQIGVTEQTYYRWRKEYGGLRLDQAARLRTLEKENQRLKRIVADQAVDIAIFERGVGGKLLSPQRRRKAVDYVRARLSVSERRACRVLRQPRSTQRYCFKAADEEEPLTIRIVELAAKYGRYGYRRITALLRDEGWRVNHKRVERIWRREGLKVPAKHPKRGRLWFNDGSCTRLRPAYKDHVWSYDFVADRTKNGRPLKMLTLIDEYTRECLAIKVARSIRSQDVLECIAELFLQRGTPGHIRSDNGPEFTAKAVREWLSRVDVKSLFIEPGSPWEHGYVESFNGKFRDELLNGEIFFTLTEAKVLVERWRHEYNTKRPHSSLGYRPPAPETVAAAPPLGRVPSLSSLENDALALT